jgi:hypothetical protein
MSVRTVNYVTGAVMVFLALFAGAAFAQHSHDHSGGSTPIKQGGMSHDMSMMNRPVQSVTVKGVKINLDVMDMEMHMHMQGMKGNPVHSSFDQKQSHAIMVMLEDAASKKTIKDADVTIALTYPDGKKETSKVAWSSDHYGLGFSPAKSAVYGIQVDVDLKGVKREAAFKYEVKYSFLSIQCSK